MKTTLNQIRAHHPCAGGWEKLLAHLGKVKSDDEPLAILTILESNGLEDALWALRAVEGKDREIRLMACDFAESVLGLFEKKHPDDKRPREAIEVARKFAKGEATKKEMFVAEDGAWAAAWDALEAAEAAARAAADAAEDAAGEAAEAVWAAAEAAASARAAAGAAARAARAAWAAERKKQKDILRKYCEGSK